MRTRRDRRLIATVMTVQLLLDRGNAVCLCWPDYFQRLWRDWRQSRLGGERD